MHAHTHRSRCTCTCVCVHINGDPCYLTKGPQQSRCSRLFPLELRSSEADWLVFLRYKKVSYKYRDIRRASLVAWSWWVRSPQRLVLVVCILKMKGELTSLWRVGTVWRGILTARAAHRKAQKQNKRFFLGVGGCFCLFLSLHWAIQWDWVFSLVQWWKGSKPLSSVSESPHCRDSCPI